MLKSQRISGFMSQQSRLLLLLLYRERRALPFLFSVLYHVGERVLAVSLGLVEGQLELLDHSHWSHVEILLSEDLPHTEGYIALLGTYDHGGSSNVFAGLPLLASSPLLPLSLLAIIVHHLLLGTHGRLGSWVYRWLPSILVTIRAAWAGPDPLCLPK